MNESFNDGRDKIRCFIIILRDARIGINVVYKLLKMLSIYCIREKLVFVYI